MTLLEAIEYFSKGDAFIRVILERLAILEFE
jgi:hypothetical protein